MKKSIIFLVTLCLAVSLCIIPAFAANTSATQNNVLTSPQVSGVNPEGTSPPSGNWNLGNGTYGFVFNFDTLDYSNANLITNTGTINWYTTCSSSSQGQATFDLWKAGLIPSLVGKQYLNLHGYSSGKFTGLQNGTQYYFVLDKTPDGLSANGSGYCYQ